MRMVHIVEGAWSGRYLKVFELQMKNTWIQSTVTQIIFFSLIWQLHLYKFSVVVQVSLQNLNGKNIDGEFSLKCIY